MKETALGSSWFIVTQLRLNVGLPTFMQTDILDECVLNPDPRRCTRRERGPLTCDERRDNNSLSFNRLYSRYR